MISIEKRVFERHEYFMRLIKQNYGCIGWSLNNYPWIMYHERDDYVQEMMIACWKGFDNWFEIKDSGLDFGVWLLRRCKFAILKYRRSLKTTFDVENKFIPRMVFYENMEEFDIMDDGEDLNPHIDGIIRAVNDLSIEEQKIVQIYLTEDSLEKKSLKDGKHPHYYAGRFDKIRQKIRKNKDRYFSGITVYKNKSAGKIMRSENNVLNKPVHQIDPITGAIIKRYPAINVAVENGFDPKKISAVLNGQRKTHRGFIWQYCNN